MSTETALSQDASPLVDPAWRAHLEEKGFAVVKQAASKQDVNTAKNLIVSDLEGSYPRLARNDPSTCSDNTTATGIDANLAQTAGPWYIRGLERVQKAFRLFSRTMIRLPAWMLSFVASVVECYERKHVARELA